MGAKWSPERKAAWRAKMAESNNRPAKGAGRGGPANGPGWGGEAKGAGTGKMRRKAPDFTSETGAEAGKIPRDLSRIARREELEGFWSSVVFDEDEATNYRIAAAEKLYDRKYGVKESANTGPVEIIGGLPDDGLDD